jgi:hypothetical protein
MGPRWVLLIVAEGLVGGEALEEFRGDAEGGFNVLFADGFRRVVADAAGRAEEKHSRRDTGGEGHSVVAGSAREDAGRETGGGDGVGEDGGEAFVHGDGWFVHGWGPCGGEVAAAGDGLGFSDEGFD